MKSYNKCQGCGLVLQSENDKQPGYTPKQDAPICESCFKARHYGEYKNDLTIFNREEFLSKISKGEKVFMVVDVLNPFETMIKEINQYVLPENLIILVSKVDLLPKSTSHDSIINWIDLIGMIKGIEFSNISLLSNKNKLNIDAVSNFILSNKGDYSMVGFSNVGKSSVIKSLFNSVGKDVKNSISNSIGTTKEIIELDFDEEVVIKDFPGFLLKGAIQNVLDKEQLDLVHPKKEIKAINYQLRDDTTISLGGFAAINIELKEKNDFQFYFSNELEINRAKNFKSIFDDVETVIVEPKNNKRKDIIISGLGKITFTPNGEKIKLILPKGIHWNIIDSLYN